MTTYYLLDHDCTLPALLPIINTCCCVICIYLIGLKIVVRTVVSESVVCLPSFLDVQCCLHALLESVGTYVQYVRRIVERGTCWVLSVELITIQLRERWNGRWMDGAHLSHGRQQGEIHSMPTVCLSVCLSVSRSWKVFNPCKRGLPWTEVSVVCDR